MIRNQHLKISIQVIRMADNPQSLPKVKKAVSLRQVSRRYSIFRHLLENFTKNLTLSEKGLLTFT